MRKNIYIERQKEITTKIEAIQYERPEKKKKRNAFTHDCDSGNSQKQCCFERQVYQHLNKNRHGKL